MREIEFTKAQGLGNDFIIVDCLANNPEISELSQFAVRICDRSFGIGGDGLILVLSSDIADYRMQIINSDGSEAEMCGNGIRCFARYLLENGMGRISMTIETLAGVKTVETVFHDSQVTGFRVNMGASVTCASDIPVLGYDGQVISQPLVVDGASLDITCVSMGNPHCIIFVDDVSEVPLAQLGSRIETSPAFPRKTNVEFVQVVNRNEIKVRVWERGAGVTLACGTGACASVVAGVLNGRIDRNAVVHLPGGDLSINWSDTGDIYMTGAAEQVFTGKYPIK
jgi:diaminopimelate epimerase